MALAKKSLGQHWLTDKASLQAMCDAANVSEQDIVVEVGPGLGSLTAALTKRAKKVIAVEKDESLAKALPNRVIATNLQIYNSDILTFDFSALPKKYKVVANIPYYLTSRLIRILSEDTNPPTGAVLLVQNEVAQRVAAEPGDMSLLSVTAQYYWEVSLGRVVPASLFSPPPKVDSRILIMKRRAEALFPGIITADYFRIVKAGYSSRRKKLLNSLASGLKTDRNRAADLLVAAGVSANSRPQELSLREWHDIYLAVGKGLLLR